MKQTAAQTAQFVRSGDLFVPDLGLSNEADTLNAAVPALSGQREASSVREGGAEGVRTSGNTTQAAA